MISERKNTRLPDAASMPAHRRIVCTWAVLLCLPVSMRSLRAQETAAPEAAASPKRLAIAILGLENQTGNPELDHCRYATALLRNALEQAKVVRVLSQGAVRYALREVGLRPGGAIDPNHARTMGEYIEAQRVIWGHYAKDADLWQVGVRVVNVATGAVSRELCAEADDWYDLRDSLQGQVLAELGITPSAEERQKMAERWTRSAEALDWCFKVQFFQDQGKPITDLEILSRKTIAADPNCAMGYANLAATLATQGKFEEAEAEAARALELKSDFAPARAILGWTYLTQRQYARAETELRRACQLDGNDVESLTWLGVACGQNGRQDEALGLMEKAVALDRTDAGAHAYLANAYATRQRQNDALRELEEARRYLPDGIFAGNVLLMMGETYRSLGRCPEAIDSYKRAIARVNGLGVNPTILHYIEQRIQGVKSILAPTVIAAAMPRRYTEGTFDAIVRDRLSETERSLAAHPFLCTDAMRQWARELTQGADTDLGRVRTLFGELSARPDTTGQPASRTAREVFGDWRKPEIRLVCMDKAVLFVALARAVGVNAFLVHVTRLPDGKVTNHACAAVFLEGRALLVDPTQYWLGAPHQQYTILDDLQATAFLCFNNRGGDPAQLAACRAGLKLWPDSLQGRVFLVDALYHASQVSEARQVFAEIPPPQSADWEAAIYWTVAGESEAVERHWEQAQDFLLRSLSIWPGQSVAHFHLGMVCARQKRLAEARAAFRACLRNEPPEWAAEMARGAIALINEEIGVETPGDATGPGRQPQ